MSDAQEAAQVLGPRDARADRRGRDFPVAARTSAATSTPRRTIASPTGATSPRTARPCDRSAPSRRRVLLRSLYPGAGCSAAAGSSWTSGGDPEPRHRQLEQPDAAAASARPGARRRVTAHAARGARPPRVDWPRKVEDLGPFPHLRRRGLLGREGVLSRHRAEIDTLRGRDRGAATRCIEAAQRVIEKRQYERFASPEPSTS